MHTPNVAQNASVNIFMTNWIKYVANNLDINYLIQFIVIWTQCMKYCWGKCTYINIVIVDIKA